jgi:simple sugar transport system permease protein
MKITSKIKNNILKTFTDIGFMGPFVILVILIIMFAIFTPDHNFIRLNNIKFLLFFGPETAIIVLGVGILMISGEFDLSIG